MEPTGLGYYGVMLIGEALGAEEMEAGRPFVGRAGKQLNEAISWAGLDRDGFWTANAVWCRPPENKLEGEPYEAGATAHCYKHHLGPHIAAVKPRVLVPLGNVPLQLLLGFKSILKTRGYVYRKGEQLVIPSIHPSFIQRGQTKWIQVLVHDLQRAVEVAREGYHPARVNYLLDPTPEAAMAYVERMIASGQPIAYDIETPRKAEDEGESDLADSGGGIIRVGFSAGEYTGLSVSFAKRYHPAIARALASPNAKIVWNGAFDNPRLHAEGFDINGVIHDGMIAWHVLHSDLPKGLGFVATFMCPEQPAWKHLSRDSPAYYNATDADVEWRATHRIFEWLKRTGLWSVYERHVLKIDQIFAKMSRAGMPVDGVIRLEKAQQLTRMMEDVDAEIQTVVPPDVRPVHPKNGYKKKGPVDGDTEGWRKLPNGNWARVKKFVPSSGKNGGIVRYQDYLRHIPVIRERKRTTDEPALQQLMLRYPEDKLYPLLLKRRKIEKIGGTYVGWAEEEEGPA